MIAAFLTRLGLPRWVLILLAIVAAIGAAAWWHDGAADRAIAAAEKRGAAAENSRLTGRIERLQAGIEKLGRKATDNIREKANAKLARVAVDADDLRLRGAGKASCPGPAATPAASGGRQSTARQADAAVDPLPDRQRVELIGMPFAGAVAFAEQHDRCLIEAGAWREQRAALERIRSDNFTSAMTQRPLLYQVLTAAAPVASVSAGLAGGRDPAGEANSKSGAR